ncbi:hypothetical protein Dsin_008870 [Dipteronia sinensis]|uniref:Uncharacterized protein n=1 Tax=Dipteronia sinensis TaxID=43782 RepID=A0AAE0ECY8_9ROSI|nr:hypothetical protein Dsin_008870 [Dipteronia sinensis]
MQHNSTKGIRERVNQVALLVIATGGRNKGRLGIVKNREKQKGSFEPSTFKIRLAMSLQLA